MQKTLTYSIAAVWIVNGLFSKVFGLTPRHGLIISRILGDQHYQLLTVIIGLAEVLMAIWILSRYKSRINAITQIIIVLAMNILEFFLTPDLLLWGKLNMVFALLFVSLVYYNEFILQKIKST